MSSDALMTVSVLEGPGPWAITHARAHNRLTTSVSTGEMVAQGHATGRVPQSSCATARRRFLIAAPHDLPIAVHNRCAS